MKFLLSILIKRVSHDECTLSSMTSMQGTPWRHSVTLPVAILSGYTREVNSSFQEVQSEVIRPYRWMPLSLF